MWVDTGRERYSAQVLLAFSLDGEATGRDPWYVHVPTGAGSCTQCVTHPLRAHCSTHSRRTRQLATACAADAGVWLLVARHCPPLSHGGDGGAALADVRRKSPYTVPPRQAVGVGAAVRAG